MESVPHAEFIGIPGPKIGPSPETFDRIRNDSLESRDLPSSPGHNHGVPRISTQSPQDTVTKSDPDQQGKARLDSPVTAVNSPVSTPSQDAPPQNVHTQERTARHVRGTKRLHEEINSIFSGASSTSEHH